MSRGTRRTSRRSDDRVGPPAASRLLRSGDGGGGGAGVVAEPLEARRLFVATFIRDVTPPGADAGVLSVPPVTAGDDLFFVQDSTSQGAQLWKTDGTTAGTVRVIDPHPAHTSALITGLTPFLGDAFFFASDPAGDGLWRSDGTPAGTVLVKRLRQGSNNTLPTQTSVAGANADRLIFPFYEANGALRIWSSDGTAAGTVPVWSVPTTSGWFVSALFPGQQGQVLFIAGSEIYEHQTLYVTDGTAAGTRRVAGPLASIDWTQARQFTPFQDHIYFTAGQDQTLWRVRPDGTGLERIEGPGNVPMTYVGGLKVMGDRLLFLGSLDRPGNRWLVATDGTQAGTVAVTESSETKQIGEIAPVSDTRALFFARANSGASLGLWETDGTPAGTRSTLSVDGVSGVRFVRNGLVYFDRIGQHTGNELWQTDGTAAGTKIVQDIKFGPEGSYPTWFGEIGDRVILRVGNGWSELWNLDLSVPSGTIGGWAFFDRNRDGLRQGFESAANVTAYLDLDTDAVRDATEPAITTHDTGRYEFAGLPPGRWVVRFEPAANPVAPNTVPGGDRPAHDVTLQTGQVLDDRNLGLTVPGTVVWGTVFNDADADGARGPNELGLAGQQLYLDTDNDRLRDAGEPLATTAADGTYAFTGPPGGTYVVRRVDQPGWRQTLPAGSPRGGGSPVTVADGQAATAAPFGVAVAAAGSIRGAVWNDWNADRNLDGGDTPRPGVQVYVDLNEDGVLSAGQEPATVTGAFGTYGFPSLVPGPSTVRLVPNSAVQQTWPWPGTGHAVDVPPGGQAAAPEVLLFDPAATPPTGRIAGQVWLDRDRDGLMDLDEPPLPGHTVYMDAGTPANGALDVFERRARTNAAGVYSFPRTAAGTYTLRLAPPDGTWSQTVPAGGAGIPVTLTGGQQMIGQDFGVFSDDATPPTVRSAAFVPFDPSGPATPPHLLVTFSEDVAPVPPRGGIGIVDRDTGAVLESVAMRYDPATATATFSFPAHGGGAPPAGRYRATLPAGGVTDPARNPLAADYHVDFDVRAAVAGRHVFYNNSAYDTPTAAQPARGDDTAVAPDKRMLLPGQSAGPANYSSYARGVNGIMIDIVGLPVGGAAALSTDDFAFAVGNAADPGAWSAAPPAPQVTVREGAGANGADRVALVWPDGAVKNQWLRVALLATADTGLAAPDVFYFGSAVGDTFNSATAFRVDSRDVTRTRNAQAKPTTIGSLYDHNRDGRVNTQDLALTRNNQGFSLQRITAPAAAAAAAVAPAGQRVAPRQTRVGATALLREGDKQSGSRPHP